MQLTNILTHENINMVIHICSAIVAGGIIGLERSFHGRPAGFRTHTLVCMASSTLMMLTLYQSSWAPGATVGNLNMDPTRMAQGIMTGIGFLGAGVIYKDGVSVRGLTTAASIWATAAIGILMGVGLFFPASLATLFTFGILSFFNKIEHAMPKRSFIHCNITFAREKLMSEENLKKLFSDLGLSLGTINYHSLENGAKFEYQMVARTMDENSPAKLVKVLSEHPEIVGFHISPSGD